jgi:MFS family permease
MRRSPLAILFVTVFIDLLGFGIVVPFLAYYVESFGASASKVGFLMASFSAMQFVFAPVWGRASDRVGRRPIILVGLFGSAVGFTLFGLAGSLSMLFLGRIIAGVSGATISTAQAYIADSTTPANRAKGMGLIGAAFGLGFIVGPALGGLLAGASLPLARALGDGRFSALLRENPYALPSLAAAALSLANLAAASVFLPESLPEALRAQARARPHVGRLAALREGLASERLRGLVVIGFVFTAGFAMMETTFTLLVERRLPGVSSAEGHALLVRRVGWVFALIGVIATAMQAGLAGRLARRFGEEKMLLAGILSAGVGLAWLPLSTSWGGFFLGAAVLAFASGLTNPSYASLVSRAASADRQGGTLGVSQAAAALARVVGPFVAGLLFQKAGPASPYVVAALLAGLAALVATRLRTPGEAPSGPGREGGIEDQVLGALAMPSGAEGAAQGGTREGDGEGAPEVVARAGVK